MSEAVRCKIRSLMYQLHAQEFFLRQKEQQKFVIDYEINKVKKRIKNLEQELEALKAGQQIFKLED